MESKRALRRYHTRRVSRRRILQRAKSYVWSGDNWPDRLLELEKQPLRYSKMHSLGCPCRKRYKGHPRNGGPGMCKSGMRWRHYQLRIEARKLVELARGFKEIDWDSDWAVLKSSVGNYDW